MSTPSEEMGRPADPVETERQTEHGEERSTEQSQEGSAGTAPQDSMSWTRVLAMVVGVAAMVQAGLSSVLVTIGAILLLVLVHEAGHFLAAKATGIEATQFFVGFGPKIVSKTFRGTEYGIKALPLGGYVRISGMGADLENERGYARAKPWKRAVVVAAGPLTNIVAAVVILFIALGGVGVPQPTNTVAQAVEGRPAALAGVRDGDVVVSVNGTPTPTWNALTEEIGKGGELVLGIERDGEPVRVSVAAEQVEGRFVIGISPAEVAVRAAPGEAAQLAVTTTGELVTGSARGIGQLFTGLGEMAGGQVEEENRPLSPVGAVRLGVQAQDHSPALALSLLAMYSVFIGVFNLLPIPPLDGGHLAVLGAERVASRVRRREVRISPAAQGRVAMITVSFLLGLGVLALLLDVLDPIANPF